MKKQEKKIYECIKCGKCNAVCPIHSKPILAYKQRKILIQKNEKEKDPSRIKDRTTKGLKEG